MGHVVQAFLAHKDVNDNFIDVGIHPARIRLPQGLTMIPLSGELYDRISDCILASGRDKQDEMTQVVGGSGFRYFSPQLNSFGLMLSHHGKVAYIETDYFGGVGSQGAVVWENEKIIYGSYASNAPYSLDLPINQALKMMGIQKMHGLDEFATIGIDRYRENKDWEQSEGHLREPHPVIPFLGFSLAAITTRSFVEKLVFIARERHAPFTAAYLNAATVNMAFESAEYARLLAKMDLLYADGMAVVWAARHLGRPIPERINAGDFTPEFMRRFAREGLKLALVGGRPARSGEPSEADRAADIFRQWAPGLNIVLTHHGYLDAPEADAAAAAAIERADPDLVLLGMGSPRQERRALAWAAAGRPRAWWCVGALFEYYAGTRARAPIWMRRAGLEWTFRLALEPGRLWRRYLIGNPAFIMRVLRGRPPKGLDE